MRLPMWRFLAVAAGVACAALSAPPALADLYALGPVGSREMARYDAAGRFVETVPAGFESVEGLTVSPDGWVYTNGNGLGYGTLARAPVGGPFDWQTVVPWSSTTPYRIPFGLASDSQGRVYATSTAFARGGLTGALRYDPADGTFVPVATAATDPPEPFRNLTLSVAPSPAGDIYLLRNGIGIERYSGATGQLVGLLVPTAAIEASEDIEFGPDGRLYVPTPNGVDRYDAESGALVDHFITNGPGGLDGARDISFGGDGNLYVNSPAAGSVLRFDAITGAFRDVFITRDQYRLGPERLRQIAYVVHEPGTVALIVVPAGALLLSRRRPR